MDINEKKPAITVFMPVYNAERYLKEAVDSILNQTFTDFELLVVNDGSTDRSVEILESYTDSRIRIIHNEGNKGLPYSRNRGLELARGRYLAIMDADDVSDRNRLQIQYDILEKNISLVVLATGKELLSESDHFSYGLKEKVYSYLFYRKPEQIRIDMMFHNMLINSSTMIRLDFLKKNQIMYNSKCFVMQDYELWTQICGVHGQIAILREPLVKYRSHADNISNRTRSNKSDARKKMQLDIQKAYVQSLGFDEDTKIIDYLRMFGLEWEEQDGIITTQYLEELFAFYQTIIKESNKNNVFPHKELVRYLRLKYLLTALKCRDKSLRNVLRSISIK